MTDIPDKEEARLRARYLNLFAQSEQAAITRQVSQPENLAEPVNKLVKQANLVTGARDLLTLAVSSFLALLELVAGRGSSKDSNAGDNPRGGND